MKDSPAVLIIGGTRYVGRRLVEAEAALGRHVTVATRGRAPVPDAPGLDWMEIDRTDRASLLRAFGRREWDVVYDQLCYAPTEAADIAEALAGRAGRYIMTSSQMVYRPGRELAETAFDPYGYGIRMGTRADFDYGEGKRLAEAAVFQCSSFPAAAVRFPVILGPDDYTRRIVVPMERIRAGLPLSVPDPYVEMSLISSAEAARFLVWLGDQDIEGAFNAASTGCVRVSELIGFMEDAVKREALRNAAPDDDPFSLWTAKTLTLDTTRAREAGFVFDKVDDWLPGLIDDQARSRVGRHADGPV